MKKFIENVKALAVLAAALSVFLASVGVSVFIASTIALFAAALFFPSFIFFVVLKLFFKERTVKVADEIRQSLGLAGGAN